jgi:hypothetical protein
MKLDVLTEPSLEFAGGGRHLDPRFGVMDYGPADLLAEGAPRRINVGFVGEEAELVQLQAWLKKCEEPIAGKDGPGSGLFPGFPGFRSDSGYRSELAFEPRLRRPIRAKKLEEVASLDPRKRIQAAVALYLEELATMVGDGRPDVVICVIPSVVLELENPPAPVEVPDVTDRETAESETSGSFHDLLKAPAMPHRVPLQLVRPSTYDAKRMGRQKRRTWKRKQRQDDASVAWNFFTALYYKAGGTPWRMVRASTDLDACYVGVAFFRTPDGDDVASSVAQIYNQRGDGVIVRGGPAHRSTEDRQLHLSADDAEAVLADALEAYRQEHRHAPARVVVHKTSAFDDAERDGMLRAGDDAELDSCELLWISNPTTRLFRSGYHPPLRGTFMELDASHGVLYSRGSVEWFGTYPGMYVPKPISLRGAHLEMGMREIAEEVLALSKMNWNSTRFDGRLPVSIRTARRVADIIRHLPAEAHVEPTYAYYM